MSTGTWIVTGHYGGRRYSGFDFVADRSADGRTWRLHGQETERVTVHVRDGEARINSTHHFMAFSDVLRWLNDIEPEVAKAMRKDSLERWLRDRPEEARNGEEQV